MTTRFRDDDFLGALLGTVHETGHGRYEQNLPRDWLGQPLAEARSMAVHESCSLAFEMQLGGHPGFVARLAPLLAEAFGDQPAYLPDNLHRLMTRVKPGPIRVDADEVTYAAHIIQRYEIERPLIEGEVDAEDIPALWDAKSIELLGIDVRGNYRDGPMQDVHWPSGAIGYFPSYTLGALIAAQLWSAIERDIPGARDDMANGRFVAINDWRRDKIWSQASKYPTPELIQRATGEKLTAKHFQHHLTERYLG